jgi:hypothetical protein
LGCMQSQNRMMANKKKHFVSFFLEPARVVCGIARKHRKAAIGPGLLQRSRAAGAVSVPGVERHCKPRI